MSSSDYPIVEPVLHSEESAQSYYTHSASSYDWRTGYEAAHHREAIQLAHVRDDEHVLEVACGTGRATVELAQQVRPSGWLAALDLTAAMLQQAQAKVRRMGLAQRVEFRIGNARQLPYGDDTFDVVYNAYMFDLIPVEQFEPILREFRRVLKPAGRLVLVNMSKDRHERTIYEIVYTKGWAGACRPVHLSPYAQAAGFEDVRRLYRDNRVLFLALPFGTEIVTGRKPARG